MLILAISSSFNIIYEEKKRNDTVKNTRKNIRQIYNFTRASVHMFWTIMALYMLYLISWEDACLVKMGYPKPYMVFEPGTEEYDD